MGELMVELVVDKTTCLAQFSVFTIKLLVEMKYSPARVF
jgi:hypothetical protein